MSCNYTVKDSFYVNGNSKAQVLVLDHKRELLKSEELKFEVDGKSVPFLLTHNEFWIIVEDENDYKNKTITIS